MHVIEDEKPISEVRTEAAPDDRMEKLLVAIPKLTEEMNKQPVKGGRPLATWNHKADQKDISKAEVSNLNKTKASINRQETGRVSS